MDRARTLETQGDGDGDRPEHAEVIDVTEANFDEHWSNQEDLKPEARDKYLERAKAGHLFAIEIDW